MKYLLLLFLLFQSINGIAQLENLPRNNHFNDVTRDSILSKLLQGKQNKQRVKQLRFVIQAQDLNITRYADKIRLQEQNADFLKTKSTKQDSIIINQKKLTTIQRKKTRKTAVIVGAAALVTGFIAGAVF